MIEKIGPTIYKGESIYKTGGGGGGEPWGQYYDRLPFCGIAGISKYSMNSDYVASQIKDTDIVLIHFKYKLYGAMEPFKVYGKQNNNYEWSKKLEFGSYSGKIDYMMTNPYNRYVRSYGNPLNTLWTSGDIHEFEIRIDENGFKIKMDGVDNGDYGVALNSNSTWYVDREIQFMAEGSDGNSITNFYECKIFDKNNTNEPKLWFIPAQRKIDSYIGILEAYSGVFVRAQEATKEAYPNYEL